MRVILHRMIEKKHKMNVYTFIFIYSFIATNQ